MSPVDFVGERTCAECGARLETLEWKPFCSEVCWHGFEDSVARAAAAAPDPGPSAPEPGGGG